MADTRFNLFGFRIGKKEDDEANKKLVQPSFAPPSNEDGAYTVTSAAHFGMSAIDLDGSAKNEIELITRYREMAMQPEIESAIDDIVNEAIVRDDNGKNIEIVMDNLKQPDKIKKAIEEEFRTVLKLLNYENMSSDIFRRYYIDGRLFYHMILDIESPQKGIQELRYIDPRKIRKVREVRKQKDNNTATEIVVQTAEYYVYSDRVSTGAGVTAATSITGVKISPDSIININSGLMDSRRAMVLSYLHKAIKPLNQLRMIEDAIVIYRLSRAPERRVFYVDVGNLPRIKAEQHVRDMMTKYKNKLVYDACLSMDTLIPLMDGRTLPLHEIQKEFESGKELWVYSCDPNTGKFAPGLVSSAGVTKFNQKVLKITLDNGKSITCTYDHKFPVWNKGKVEAKDLQVGDSMIPYYAREKSIVSGSNSKYQQIFDNDSKKWQFTHRLVSAWKDEVGLNNEWVFDESFSDKPKQTVHHIDYNRLNNSPLNLTRMYRDDHFAYHKKHNSLAGKIGGPIAAKKQQELGIGIFGLTQEQRSEIGKTSGKIGGKSCYNKKNGIHGLSKEQIKQNSKKGSESLQNLLQDPEYNKEFGRKIAAGFTENSKKLMSERGESIPKERFALMNKLANESRWNSELGEINRKLHSDEQTIIYPENIFSLLENATSKSSSKKTALQFINEELDVKGWQNLNKNKKIKNRKSLSEFTEKDLNRIILQKGFSNFGEYKTYIEYKNHKITNIQYLEETIDVGTLGIDKEEIYHDYHTFALDAGIYTCNSTGEVRDDRRHLSILEDFWMPRRSGDKSTEITTLPAGQNLGQIEDIQYFERKLYKSLNVPVTRLDPGQAVSIGRSTEITRDELKFAKFIDKLRNKFSELFDQALRVQLVLKGVCTEEEWKEFKEYIYYDFIKDNNFVELKEAELMQERLGLLAIIDQYAGKYYSKKWIQQNVLRLNDLEIEEMEEEIQEERQTDFAQQSEDQEREVTLQAQQQELMSKLMPPTSDQQIEAGAEPQAEEQPQQEAPKKNNNPYNV